MVTGIRSLDDLANQEEVEYGTLSHSAPYQVFKDSTTNPYKKIYLEMKNNIDKRYKSFVSTTKEGIKMVRESSGTKHSKSLISLRNIDINNFHLVYIVCL